ncbi:MAG: hypothetical protein KAJ78_10070, partial [Acidobacteria bacterium]|nr:hypothetical protein [Acidobacteriota bacterium]
LNERTGGNHVTAHHRPRQGPLPRTPSRSTAAVTVHGYGRRRGCGSRHRTRTLLFIPGLLECLWPSSSVHFPQGQQGRNWESIALEGNDLDGLHRRPRLDCWRRGRGEPGVALLRNGGSVGSSAW